MKPTIFVVTDSIILLSKLFSMVFSHVRTYTLLPVSDTSLLGADNSEQLTHEVVAASAYPVQVSLPLELSTPTTAIRDNEGVECITMVTQPQSLPSRR